MRKNLLVLLSILCLLPALVMAQGYTVSGPISIPDGAANCSTVGLPFAADTDTGLVRTGANAMGICSNGVLEATFNTSGLSLTDPLPVTSGGTGLATTTISQILYSSAANTIAGLATANNGVLITSGAGVPSISSTIPSATQDNITRLGTIAVPLVVSSVGPHAIGGTTSANYQFRYTGTFAGSVNAHGLVVDSTLTPPANGSSFAVFLGPTINKAGSGTHADFATFYLDAPAIGAGAAALTNVSTLKIASVATGGTNNYALWSAAGVNRFDGNIGETANRVPGIYNGATGLDSTGLITTTATLRTSCVAIASLPAGVEGDRKCVTDQLTTCPALDGTFTAGGTVRCSAFYNGTAWVHS